MIIEDHHVACTVLVKDEEGRYVFLVKRKEEGFSFLATEVEHRKTGLACVLNRLKEMIKMDIEKLELNELTNAVVDNKSIPLFVFIYENNALDTPNDLLPKDSELSWVHSENIINTLEQWKISGVPQFLLI